MGKRLLQTYSTWAKDNLENQIEVSLKALGINDDVNIKEAKQVGDFTVIEGDATTYPAELFGKRLSIVSLIQRQGYRNVIGEFAYTWFNRFVALRFMEVHGFLSHGFRVLSNSGGGIEPEILKNLNLVKDELKLDMKLCSEYKEQGKVEELYRHVLTHQCNALSSILPMLFSVDFGYLELLLPKTLLKGETVITRLLEIPEKSFLEDVEIIGWMYQFYISSKKDAVYASKKTITKDTLPAVTQLFTPDWIVRYMAQNSVGRLWLESYPNSTLRSEMKYYVKDAKQTEAVQRKIGEIKYKNVNPEEIRIIEPCCGSGHILVYVFDLLYKMYEERGYQKRDIPTLILTKNLTGLDVDKRAVQLASFSLIMKARSVNNRFFDKDYFAMPRVYELKDSKYLLESGYRKHIKDFNILSDIEVKTIDCLVDSFKEGKTIGSLLKLEPINFSTLDAALEKINTKVVPDIFNSDFLRSGIRRIQELSVLAKALTVKYDVMITNPPYRPISSMEATVSAYAVDNYPNSKADMFAMFMETNFVKPNGFTAMINMHSWMFLATYMQLRESVLHEKDIVNLLHLGPHAFETIGGEIVQTVTFVTRNARTDFVGKYYRLVDYNNADEKEKNFLTENDASGCYLSNTGKFFDITGTPIAYWISDNLLKAFSMKSFGYYGETKKGVLTGNDKVYLRLWYEVSEKKIGFGLKNYDDMVNKNFKWIPETSGGTFRKWYGNFENVVNMENDSYAIRYCNKNNFRLRDNKYYFREAITWSEVSGVGLSVRYVPQGILFGNSGPVCFFAKNYWTFMALLNSKISLKFLEFLSPTLTFGPEQIQRIPVDDAALTNENLEADVKQNIQISKAEWDSFEVSWDFKHHPLIPVYKQEDEAGAIDTTTLQQKTLSSCYNNWKQECVKRYEQMKANEEGINRIFIHIYGLQNELIPDVENKEVSVRLANKERDIRSLISYLIGLVMGRYSLEMDGLAYAGGDWAASKYGTYQPNDDGIVPIYTNLGMEDGLTTKLTDLIKQIYGEDTYRQNIDFIAEALGKNNNESSEETLNRYLNDEQHGFYAEHLKVYQKRPIYWMFSSGKKAGFKCLIYMHRYNEDTLARINSKYYLPESTRKKNELDELNSQIAKAEGRDRIRLEKERQNLVEAYNEAIEYGQVLDHMANKYISIDLDDGVKDDYAKFQGIELVTDSGAKVKKDLLVPLK